MTQPEQVTCPVDKMPGESVIVLYFEDQKPLDGPAALLDWRLDGQLTRLLLDGQVKGRAGEHVMLQSNGKLQAEWVLFVGGGKWFGLSEETHASLVRHMMTVARQAGFRKLSLAFRSHEDVPPEMVKNHVGKALAEEGQVITDCLFSCDTPIAVS